MLIAKKKILIQLIGGMLGGTILGMICLVKTIGYGNSCLPSIDEAIGNVFNTGIFASCGSVVIFGVIFGSFLGVIILKKLKIINYLKTICIFISSAVILFFLGGVLSGSWISYINYFLIIPQVILFFILSSGISSLVIIIVTNPDLHL